MDQALLVCKEMEDLTQVKDRTGQYRTGKDRTGRDGTACWSSRILGFCKMLNCDVTQVESLASRGGLLYRQAGSPESAAQLLVRAAKLLEGTRPEDAIGLYQKVR